MAATTPTTVVFHGFNELIKASREVPKAMGVEVRGAFGEVGEIVRADATPRFAKYSVRSAAGFRVVVRQRGVSVEQSLRKTTGLHPEWGKLQMRKALLPALRHSEPEVEAAFTKAVDRSLEIFKSV